ncbi:MAG: 2-C-methyl-D-erythritol 4-phosphate cytidylyltransferase [Bacteroidota bacterium]
MSVSVIIPAAGSGTRLGGMITKQFIELKGKPIIVYSIEKFEKSPEVSEIIIVTQRIYFNEIRNLCNRYHLAKVKEIIEGGKTRQDSVRNGLEKVNKKSKFILVHDAVRPFISTNLISDAISTAKKTKASVVAVAAKDTIKLSNEKNIIEKTFPREKLWIIQTPQVFEAKLLNRAYQNAFKKNILATDDASLVEAIGVNPQIVVGEYENIKITTREDLEMAELILNRNSYAE